VAKNGAYVKALTAKELYKAIKSGKTFATTGPSLNLDVNGELMGDTAYVFDGAADINLRVNAVTPGYLLYKINIIKNGVIWATITPYAPNFEDTLEDVVTEDGYYRVEVTSINIITGKTEDTQFAWSNPVFVRVP
jgi:hypothetical protein